MGVDVVTSVIDAESRGEIRVVVHNGTDKTVSIDPGKAVAQILFSPIAMPGIHRGRSMGSAAVGADDSVRHGSSHRRSGGSSLTAGIGAGSTQHCDPKRGGYAPLTTKEFRITFAPQGLCSLTLTVHELTA